jgi:DNA-binding LacI/PurR family transcriptional regulator
MATKADTIADIARIAGVSKSTVSRALNDSPLIGNETKDKIRAIAAEHDFHLNAPARRLRLKQSNAIAFVTYPYKSESGVPDVFMLEMMSGVSAALHAEGYDLLIVPTHPTDTSWVREYLDAGRVDGFVLLSATCTEAHLQALLDLKAPFITWGVLPWGRGHSSVSGDSVNGGRLATEHLLESGRSRIAFLGGPAEAPEIEDRYRGYEAALAAAGQTVDPALVVHAWWSEEAAANAMRELLERAPDLDAVFVNSDLMAFTAMDAIRDAGRRVPEDVAVVGYDDVSLARFGNPPLTTIRQNGPLAGQLLGRNLIEHIRTGVVTNVSIPAELVVRDST